MLEVFSWTLCFITNEKGAESSKILKVFVHVPLLTRDDDRRYFPGLDCVSETTMCHSLRASVTTFTHVSLFTEDDDSAQTALYSAISDRHVFGIFVALPQSVLLGFKQEGNISLEAGFGQILFLSAVFVVFYSRYQSTLIPVPPSIRPS